MLMFCEFGVKMPIQYSCPFWVVFGDFTPRWDIISKKLPKVKSTCHNGSVY